jgi:hypothetical protein
VKEDRETAMGIVDKLEDRSVSCWIAPRDVQPGNPFDEEIADAIDNCLAVLLVFSDRCNQSSYIRREVTVAGEAHKKIIPFRIEDSMPKGGLRLRLSDLHYIDAFNNFNVAIDQLARLISGINRI